MNPRHFQENNYKPFSHAVPDSCIISLISAELTPGGDLGQRFKIESSLALNKDYSLLCTLSFSDCITSLSRSPGASWEPRTGEQKFPALLLFILSLAVAYKLNFLLGFSDSSTSINLSSKRKPHLAYLKKNKKKQKKTV